MSRSAYLDECKGSDYLMAATIVGPESTTTCREEIRRLRVAGKDRIHFNSESDAVRKRVLTRVVALAGEHDLSVTLYVAKTGRELERRMAILDRVVEDCVKGDVGRLVLEVDESTRRHDELRIKNARHRAGATDLRYYLMASSTEPLLWVADAVAWSWRRDQHWRARVRPLIDQVIDV